MIKRRYEKHKATKTTEYTSWSCMRYRCSNPKSSDYKDYGGRGIRVCKEWEDSFLSFLEDMGKKPTPKHSIDRINNDGNYEPSNCRWATPDEQANNQRRSGAIMFKGKPISYRGLARKFNMNYRTLRDRIQITGLSPEEAVRLPLRKNQYK